MAAEIIFTWKQACPSGCGRIIFSVCLPTWIKIFLPDLDVAVAADFLIFVRRIPLKTFKCSNLIKRVTLASFLIGQSISGQSKGLNVPLRLNPSSQINRASCPT